MTLGQFAGEAVFDKTERYRYTLTRYLPGSHAINWIMLNPSTADAKEDDPTIRRVINFSAQWGWGRVEVTNIYAYRATNPRNLWLAEDPVGPDNDEWIMRTAENCSEIVVAWGSHEAGRDRGMRVMQMLSSIGRFPLCLGVTLHGQPCHPLYLPKDSKLNPYVVK